MKLKLFTFITVSIISANGVIHAQTPFPVGVTVGISKPGLNAASKNYTIYTTTTPQSGNYAQGVSFTSAHDLNGIGLDSVDNFVYASTYTGDNNSSNLVNGVSLYRIGANGATVDLGYLPTTGQTSIEFPSFSAGTVSNNNAYYYLTMGLKQSGVVKILTASSSGSLNLDTTDVRVFICWINNISGLTANSGASISGGLSGYYEVNFSNPALQTAMQAYLNQVNQQYPNVYNANGGIQDIAINPTDHKIYGYFSYPQNATTTVGRPIVFNFPSGNFVTAVPVGSTINNVPNQEIDGIAFDNSGNLYGVFTTGDYAGINLTTGALSNVTPSNFATTSGNMRGDLGSATGSPFITQPLASGLINFQGKNNGIYNTLIWTTATENNNNEFVIERSYDQKQWINIGNVTSKALLGNSNSNLNYTFNDASQKTAVNYYRIQQISKAGAIFYSNIISIDNSSSNSNILVYPNPCIRKFAIKGTNKGETILLYNAQGRLILKTDACQSQTIIDIPALTSGIYQITILDSSNQTISTNKLIVQ